MSALAEVQSLDQSVDVFIYEVSGYNRKNLKERIRLSNYAGVSFGGPTLGVAIVHDSMETTSVGTQPRMMLSVSDAGGIVTSLIDSVDSVEGSIVKIYRSKRRFLDDGSTPSTTQGILQQSTLVISRVSNFVPMGIVEFELQNPVDYGDVACPSRTASQKCSWQYRGAYCGYSGTAMFDLTNSPVISAELDVCSKTLAGCRARFGNGVLPTSAFPTLQRR